MPNLSKKPSLAYLAPFVRLLDSMHYIEEVVALNILAAVCYGAAEVVY